MSPSSRYKWSSLPWGGSSGSHAKRTSFWYQKRKSLQRNISTSSSGGLYGSMYFTSPRAPTHDGNARFAAENTRSANSVGFGTRMPRSRSKQSNLLKHNVF